MYNKYLGQRELEVKAGDVVSVQGNVGTVTEVIKSIKKEWNGAEYIEVPGTESTSVRVHFTGELAAWGQYQDEVYGGFHVIEK